MSIQGKRALAVLGTLLIVALIFANGSVEGQSKQRYLMIHSDDAGMCKAVNEATMDALENGVVSSTSIMVPCPGFEEFAKYAVANPRHDYGVHLVLTSEMSRFSWGPVLGDKVPSLTWPDKTFWRTEEEVAEHADAAEVKLELQAQVRRALERGIPISHLDHHMWVLLLRPGLLRVYVELGEEFKLPIRLSREFVPKMCGKSLQDPKEYARIIQPAIDRGLPLIDYIDADNYEARHDKKRQYFIDAIRGLQPGISEFVIHCSVNRPGMSLPHAPDRREADARIFKSQEIRDEIGRMGIQVVGWKELVRLRK